MAALERVTLYPSPSADERFCVVSAHDVPAIVQQFAVSGVPIGLDVEATGTDPWANKLICIQLGDERGVFITDVRHLPDGSDEDRASLIVAVRLLISGRVELVGHNLKFDLLTLAVHLGISLDELRPLRLYDTMLAEQVILGGVDAPDGTGRERANLQATAARYGIELSKDPRNWFIDLDTRPAWHLPLPNEQVDYAARDVAVLSRIRAGQAAESAARGLKQLSLGLSRQDVSSVSEPGDRVSGSDRVERQPHRLP